ncbi:TetR/AcrR family transcriptional regulator [Lactobacillus xylocopicola]|uniref:TetR family transcriptional regulator n=1 Tax=Lactobacillus xylocopicola TaxID=2976676 RepID=A0ABN6SL46_9LACO|nr:TetR/AcrR family transcriptional regulator [Lactobacillus xylocopicola]BDR61091.1 TetR family transcriptional regulator [Lactobacillus xylocopicola]
MHTLTPTARKAKKQLIATAAGRLFHEHDFYELSMAQIAHAAGVAKGTLFNYFKTKENIFMYLLLAGYQDFLQAALNSWQSQPELSTWEDLVEFLLQQNHLLIHKQADLVRLNALRAPILEAAADREETLAERQKLYQINQTLGQAIADRIPRLSVKQASHLFVIQSAIISGLINMMKLDEFHHDHLPVNFTGFQIDLEAEAKQILKFYLQGLQKEIEVDK